MLTTREEWESLVDFFAKHQYTPADYTQINAPAIMIALAARFLLLTHWYVVNNIKKQELMAVISTLKPNLIHFKVFSELSAKNEFDCGRFSSALKAKIVFHSMQADIVSVKIHENFHK